MAFADEQMKDAILKTLEELESDVGEISQKTQDLTKQSFEDMQNAVTMPPRNEFVGSEDVPSSQHLQNGSSQEALSVPITPHQSQEIQSDYGHLLGNLSEKMQEASIMGQNTTAQKLLDDMREKMLVLFEGLQQCKEQDQSALIQKKLDMTLCYLQYALSLIDEHAQNRLS